jgi:hypothetical protein
VVERRIVPSTASTTTLGSAPETAFTAMNELQPFFTVVFGIYFAANVAAVGRFALFDTTATVAGDLRAFYRLLIGIFGFNLLQFLYFLFVLVHLGHDPRKVLEAPKALLGVFFAGIAGAGIYRMVVSLMSLHRPGSDDKYIFYSDAHDLTRDWLKLRSKTRSLPDDAKGVPWGFTFLGGILWFGVCTVLYFWLTSH